MDLSSLATMTKVYGENFGKIIDVYTKENFTKGDPVSDPLVCTFLKEEKWREMNWETFYNKHIAFMNRLVKKLQCMVK